jgi:hypothetical protein
VGKACTVETFVGVETKVGAGIGVGVETEVGVGVAVDCGWTILGVLVGVGVTEEKPIREQPLAPVNSSVSQASKTQIGKTGKRDLDTVANTSKI